MFSAALAHDSYVVTCTILICGSLYVIYHEPVYTTNGIRVAVWHGTLYILIDKWNIADDAEDSDCLTFKHMHGCIDIAGS